MITQRTRAREVALQLLFQRELNPSLPRRHIEAFVEERLKDEKSRPYSLGLYDGVILRLDEIDRRLSESAQNWKVNRMALVDRNVLRLGTYELLFDSAIPPKVVFDEAIELARRYGSANSFSFVNGVLDRIHRDSATSKA